MIGFILGTAQLVLSRPFMATHGTHDHENSTQELKLMKKKTNK